MATKVVITLEAESEPQDGQEAGESASLIARIKSKLSEQSPHRYS